MKLVAGEKILDTLSWKFLSRETFEHVVNSASCLSGYRRGSMEVS